MGPNDYNVTVRGIPRNLSASDFQLDVSSAFVSELWSCFATDLACPYFTRYLNLGGLQSPRRPNYYPGVFGFLQIVSAEQTLVYYAALDLLAENQTTGDCGTCDVHSDCVRGRCVLRHAWFHH